MTKYKYNAHWLKSERVPSRENNNEYPILQRTSVTTLAIPAWIIFMCLHILLYSNILIVREM